MAKTYGWKIAGALLLVAVVVAIQFSAADEFFNLQTLKLHRAELHDFYLAHPFGTVTSFLVVMAAMHAFGVPGTGILCLAAGVIFGVYWGTLWSVVGATIGGLGAFLISRKLIGEDLQEKYGSKIDWLNKELDRDGPAYLITLRIAPVLPAYVKNLIIGLTDVSVPTYLWTTFVGVIPLTFVFVFAGARLWAIRSLSDLWSPSVLVAIVVLTAVPALPVLWRHRPWDND